MTGMQESGLWNASAGPICLVPATTGPSGGFTEEFDQMTAFDINSSSRNVPLGSVATFRVVSLFEHAINAVVTRRNVRANEKALRALSDRQLNDIGLLRGEIAEVAETLARR